VQVFSKDISFSFRDMFLIQAWFGTSADRDGYLVSNLRLHSHTVQMSNLVTIA